MLNERVALVTGGTRGIGRGIAQALLQAGAKVMVADLGEDGGWNYKLAGNDDLQETVKALSSYGKIGSALVDVSKTESCTQAVAATIEYFGQIDILVNNAGLVSSGTIDQFKESDWDRIFAVNTKGIFLMTRAALPELRKSKNAAVLNIASIAGKKGYPNMSAYCGSKFAAIGITQSMAAELAGEKIRVNALCPGMVGTAMWFEHLIPSNATELAQKEEEFNAMTAETIPMGRAQTTEDMGKAAVYLLSAPNVTGVSLTVSGGFEMN